MPSCTQSMANALTLVAGDFDKTPAPGVHRFCSRHAPFRSFSGTSDPQAAARCSCRCRVQIQPLRDAGKIAASLQRPRACVSTIVQILRCRLSVSVVTCRDDVVVFIAASSAATPPAMQRRPCRRAVVHADYLMAYAGKTIHVATSTAAAGSWSCRRRTARGCRGSTAAAAGAGVAAALAACSPAARWAARPWPPCKMRVLLPTQSTAARGKAQQHVSAPKLHC